MVKVWNVVKAPWRLWFLNTGFSVYTMRMYTTPYNVNRAYRMSFTINSRESREGILQKCEETPCWSCASCLVSGTPCWGRENRVSLEGLKMVTFLWWKVLDILLVILYVMMSLWRLISTICVNDGYIDV